ncbi:hypothetical protein CAL26_09185 [Bordetella genomosp. 9]|uniref:Uncharacterized protein n=2 Tax=Bordetella TaxID=517 RepID=A0A261RF02_9BORD|nr:hypothetical protein BAU07_18960 [Bordetella flabilis]OZI23604.1 hypothetical protein CAL26_09185 [Bordetella genomosp. 9]
MSIAVLVRSVRWAEHPLPIALDLLHCRAGADRMQKGPRAVYAPVVGQTVDVRTDAPPAL